VALKTFFVAIATRSLVKVGKNLMNFPKFGLAFGMMSALFNLTLCIAERFKDKVALKPKTFKTVAFLIAGFISSLPINLVSKQEQNLLRLFFYPLAWRCFYDKLKELGIVPKVKHASVLFYMIHALHIGYTYTYEKQSIGSLNGAIDSYTQFSRHSNRIFWNISTASRISMNERALA